MPLRLIPSDNMELSGMEIEIRDDQGSVLETRKFKGEELHRIMDANGGEVPFEIPARGEWQTLSVSAVDEAGNRSSGIEGIGEVGDRESGWRVLVSSNLMVHLYRSGVLPAIAFLTIVLAIRYGYGVYKRTLA